MANKVKQNVSIPIQQILEKAELAQTGPDIYSNHIQISLSVNDLTIDFFVIYHKPGKAEDTPRAKHVQRVILPQNVAKGLNRALQQTISQFEEGTKIEILDLEAHEEEK
jgi:hypothetical protein